MMMILLVFSAIYIGGDWVQEQIGGSKILLVSLGIFIGLVVTIMIFPFMINTKRFQYLARIKYFFLNIFQGIMSIRMIPNTFSFWVHTAFIWLMYILMFWVIQFSLPEAALLSPQVVLIGFVAGGLTIVVTNGGIGLYPIAVSAVLSHYGMSYEMALAYGWIAWTSQTLMIILFGGLSFVLLPILNRKK